MKATLVTVGLFLGLCVIFAVCSFVAAAISSLIGKKTGRRVPNVPYLALMFFLSALAGWFAGHIVRAVVQTSQVGRLTPIVWMVIVACAVTIYASFLLVQIRGSLEKKARVVVLLPWVAVLCILYVSCFIITARALGRVDVHAARSRCASQLRQLYLFAKLYAEERNGQLPQKLNDVAALMVRGSNYPLEKWVNCPAVSREGVSNARYEYNPHVSLGEHVPLIWDRQGSHPGGRNVLFADGNVEWVTESAFQDIQGSPQTQRDIGRDVPRFLPVPHPQFNCLPATTMVECPELKVC